MANAVMEWPEGNENRSGGLHDGPAVRLEFAGTLRWQACFKMLKSTMPTHAEEPAEPTAT